MLSKMFEIFITNGRRWVITSSIKNAGICGWSKP